MGTQAQAIQRNVDKTTSHLSKLADDNVGAVPGWLAYLAESIESDLGEGWLYDLETLIRQRRERGSW